MPPGGPWLVSLDASLRLVCMVQGWGSEWFLRYKALNEVEGDVMPPGGPPASVTGCVLA